QWRLRWRRSVPPVRRPFVARAPRQCPTPNSSAFSRASAPSATVQTDKLYLVGFMGAGKSTIARAVGRRLGWRVEDIDERIEARERRSVAAIFAQNGEPYFRQLERQMLSELLPERQVIIATGGGTFAEADNR